MNPWALWSGLRTFEHMKRMLPDVPAPSSHVIERLSNSRAGFLVDIARDRPQGAGFIRHVARQEALDSCSSLPSG